MTARILVVDDIAVNVKLIEAKLGEEYYDVYTASNGVEALAQVEKTKPDLILMDVMMPEMDGFEATRRIKSDPKTSHIPLIMVTALNAQEDKVRGLESGADDFLTKPINDHALIARIKSLLRLKFLTDELRARNETGMALGLNEQPNITLQSDLSNSKVLLVDDDNVQVGKIKARFQEKSIECTSVDRVEGALEIAIAEDFDLIIISTQLLDGDGLRLCSHLRSQDKLRNTPILIMVDDNDSLTLDKGLEIGVSDYLVAPVDTNELFARSATQIRRKKFQDALKDNYASSVSMSITDPLTKLFNRRYFDIHAESHLNTARQNQKPFSMMMLDIDFFKKVNDTYGHQAGDAVLQEIAARIMRCIRASDLCARFGGEEFVLILPSTHAKEALSIAERIRTSVESQEFTIPVQPGNLKCSCSIGLDILKPEDSVETLLSRVDKALYEAKRQGRNRIVYAGDMASSIEVPSN